MSRIFTAVKRPYVWIFASVVYIWLLGLSKLFATLGPPYVFSKGFSTSMQFSVSGLGKAFLFYAQEVAKVLGYKYEYVLYCFIANIVILIPAIVVGFFVLRRKMWARNTLIFLVVAYVVYPLGIGLLTSESKFTILSFNTVILVAIIYVLMRRPLRKHSCTDEAYNKSLKRDAAKGRCAP